VSLHVRRAGRDHGTSATGAHFQVDELEPGHCLFLAGGDRHEGSMLLSSFLMVCLLVGQRQSLPKLQARGQKRGKQPHFLPLKASWCIERKRFE